MSSHLEYTQKINKVMYQIAGNYAIYRKKPTDKQIQELASLFYKRDKSPDTKFDFEMAAVERGIVQGIKLMCQMIGDNTPAVTSADETKQ